MAGYKILSLLAEDLAEEYGACNENYIRVGGKVICDTLTDNYFMSNAALIGSGDEMCAELTEGRLNRRTENGFLRHTVSEDGYVIDIYADPMHKIIFIHADREGNEAYISTMLDNIELLCVKYTNPVLEPYGRENAGRAVRIQTEPYQLTYACDVKSALCYAYAYGRESYCLRDGLRTVGVLIVDVTDDTGCIEYVAIDRRHQHKGYGRFIVSEAINLLMARGCATIRINVQDDNAAARALYESAGFHAVSHTDDYSTYEFVADGEKNT